MTPPTSPADALSSLLLNARRLRQRGDADGARTLLRSIVARYPDEPRAWLLLASVAGSRAEQQHAFQRTLALDPENQIAQRGLAAMQAVIAPVVTQPALASPAVGRAVVLEADTPEEVEQAAPVQRVRWPLYATLGIAGIVLAVAALLIWQQPATDQQAQLATAAPLAVGAATASASSINVPIVGVAPTGAAATTLPEPTVAPAEPTAAPAESVPTLDPTIVPPIEPAATIATTFGQVASVNGWNVGLLRPNDAVVLSGAIGELQPQGRFVLTLLAVGNGAADDRPLPPDLLALTDAVGNRYTPLPAASSAFLGAYGLGQAGVLSMESAIPAGGGLVSVPVIFDIPIGARGLILSVGSGGGMWKIGE